MKSARSEIRWLLHFEDWLHFQRLGEVEDITFKWWWPKYRRHLSDKAAERAWTRCKAVLRSSSLPVEFVTVPPRGEVAIHISPRAAVWIKARIDSWQRYPDDGEKRRGYEQSRRRWYYRKADPERDAARKYYETEWAASNAEARRHYQEAYRERNKARIRRQRREHLADDPLPQTIRIKQWKRDNRDYVNKMGRDYRNGRGDERWEQVLGRVGDRCAVCKTTYPRVVYDLVVPDKVRSLCIGGLRQTMKQVGEARWLEILPHITVMCANCYRLARGSAK